MDASLDHLIGVKTFQKLMNVAKEQNSSASKIDGMNQVLLMKSVRLAKQLLALSICISLIKSMSRIICLVNIPWSILSLIRFMVTFFSFVFRTRSDVVDLLDHACNVVPDEHLKMKCFDLVRQETDVVFDFIEKVTDPSVICHGMQVNKSRTQFHKFNSISSFVMREPLKN